MSETITPPTQPTPPSQLPPSERWSPQNVIAVYALSIAAATIVGIFLKGDVPTIQLVVGVVLGSALTGVLSFYFGSSQGSQKKDERPGANS